MKILLDWVVYSLVRLFFGGIARMPRPLAHRVCRGVADLVFLADFKHRRVGMINLRIAFPEKSDKWRKSTLRESFRQLGDLAVEVTRLRGLSRAQIERRVRYEPGRGLNHYLTAKGRGGAVLFLTAHISAWELLPAAHALYGHPLSFVVRPLDNRFLEKWASSLRCQFGNRVLPKATALRSALKVLRERGDVGFLIDQNVQQKDGVFVPLFGRPASTTRTLASLALKLGLPVVAGFIYPDERLGHYVIRFYPPLYFEKTADRELDVREAAGVMNRHIEEVVREFPHCWLWGHRRFRTQPDNSNPYD